MKKRAFRWSILLGVVGSCLLCFAIQGAVWEWLAGHKARFVSENYYHITLGRLQNASLLSGTTVILGSSITERLLSTDDIAVIGVPGSCFLGGMQFVNFDALPPPSDTVFVLEGNNMFAGVLGGVIADTKKWSFRAFRGSRHFSIVAKPSSLLLSLLYYGKGNAAPTDERGTLKKDPVQPLALGQVCKWGEQQKRRYASLLDGIRSLRARGYRVCISYIPEREQHRHDAELPLLMGLADAAGVPLLDYNNVFGGEELEWTDERHLNSKVASTSRLRNTLARDAHLYAR